MIRLLVDIDHISFSGWWFDPIWKIWKSIGMIIPNIWENAKNGNQTTNQDRLLVDIDHISS